MTHAGTRIVEATGRTGRGRALGEAVIGAARDIGYERMLLDTSVRQVEVLTLYARLGARRSRPTTTCRTTSGNGWSSGS